MTTRDIGPSRNPDEPVDIADENRQLRRLLMTARRLMVWAAPATEEEAWWAEVDEVLS